MNAFRPSATVEQYRPLKGGKQPHIRRRLPQPSDVLDEARKSKAKGGAKFVDGIKPEDL